MDYISQRNLELFMMNQSNKVLCEMEIVKLKNEIKKLKTEINTAKNEIEKYYLKNKMISRKQRRLKLQQRK